LWAQKAPLTTREREIASPIAPQAVDREAADRLFVSPYSRGHLYRADITLGSPIASSLVR
jgi:FixJ family two-component response regulator